MAGGPVLAVLPGAPGPSGLLGPRPREACRAPQGTLRPRGGRGQLRLCLLVRGRGRGVASRYLRGQMGPSAPRLTGTQSADGARCDLWGWGAVGFRAFPDIVTTRPPDTGPFGDMPKRLSRYTAAQPPWRAPARGAPTSAPSSLVRSGEATLAGK
uniref:Uncharacterized protein n=1 Tax=Rangifer tarandus platyrhynchus TaxID=3082113 RepID=A0ACB0F2Y4_RANTA|nr:unnamed protein product [Rangifer tarandus platyrhynchus]